MNKLIKQNDPFLGVSSLHNYIDDMFNDFWGSTSQIAGAHTSSMDLYVEDGKQMVAEVTAPGFDKDDIDINIHEGVLEISGQRTEKDENKDKKRNYVMRESAQSFFRRVSLPKHADADNIDAHFEGGVLKVTIPFKDLPKPKKVEIGSGKKKK